MHIFFLTDKNGKKADLDESPLRGTVRLESTLFEITSAFLDELSLLETAKFKRLQYISFKSQLDFFLFSS